MAESDAGGIIKRRGGGKWRALMAAITLIEGDGGMAAGRGGDYGK